MNDSATKKLESLFTPTVKEELTTHIHWWVQDALKNNEIQREHIASVIVRTANTYDSIENIYFPFEHLLSQYIPLWLEISVCANTAIPNENHLWHGIEWMMHHAKNGHEGIDWKNLIASFIQTHTTWSMDIQNDMSDALFMHIQKSTTSVYGITNIIDLWTRKNAFDEQIKTLHERLIKRLPSSDSLEFCRMINKLDDPQIDARIQQLAPEYLLCVMNRWLDMECKHIVLHNPRTSTCDAKEYWSFGKKLYEHQSGNNHLLDTCAYIICLEMKKYGSILENPANFEDSTHPWDMYVQMIHNRLERYTELLDNPEKRRRRRTLEPILQAIRLDKSQQSYEHIEALELE